jgi:hypothetical protein
MRAPGVLVLLAGVAVLCDARLHTGVSIVRADSTETVLSGRAADASQHVGRPSQGPPRVQRVTVMATGAAIKWKKQGIGHFAGDAERARASSLLRSMQQDVEPSSSSSSARRLAQQEGLRPLNISSSLPLNLSNESSASFPVAGRVSIAEERMSREPKVTAAQSFWLTGNAPLLTAKYQPGACFADYTFLAQDIVDFTRLIQDHAATHIELVGNIVFNDQLFPPANANNQSRGINITHNVRLQQHPACLRCTHTM